MTPLLIGALGFVALFALILLQVPIGFAMIIVGIAGYGLQAGWGPAFTILASERSIEIICKCPEADWPTLQPVFAKVMTSIKGG